MSKDTAARTYIAAIFAATLALSCAALLVWPPRLYSEPLWLLPTLAGLTAVAGRFPFKVSPQGDATVSTVPLFMAVLLLHPVEAALVGALGSLVAERLLKARLEVAAFNVGVSAFVGVTAGAVFWALRPEAAEVFSVGVLLAGLASGAVVHAMDLSLPLGMITLQKGTGFWHRWRGAWSFEAVLGASLLIVGLMGAQLVLLSWWWLAVLIVPFAVSYYGFRRSMHEMVQKTRLAEQLEQNLQELRSTQAQLVQSAKLAGIGTLVAGLAHEINNPLTIITGRAELFMTKLRKVPGYANSDKAIKDVQDIYEMGMRISAIMKQLLAYSRPSDLQVEARLDQVMEVAISLVKNKMDMKGVRLVRDYRDAPVVRGITNQLQQVFVNLLSNALDVSSPWGAVTIGCYAEEGAAVAYVRDNGPGIADDMRERIFEPFFTTKNIGEGTGLGLYICHKIVTEHEGTIAIDSVPDGGTTFSVRLRLAAKVAKGETVTAA